MMSWEGKWKQFQTTDRLNEAVGDKRGATLDRQRARRAAQEERAREREANRAELRALGAARSEPQIPYAQLAGQKNQWDSLGDDEKQKVASLILGANAPSEEIAAYVNKTNIRLSDDNLAAVSDREFDRDITVPKAEEPVSDTPVRDTPYKPSAFRQRIEQDFFPAGTPSDRELSMAMSKRDVAKQDYLSGQKVDEPTTFGQKLKKAAAVVTSPVWAPIKATQTHLDKKGEKKDFDNFKRWRKANVAANINVEPPDENESSLDEQRSSFEKRWKNYQKIVEQTEPIQVAYQKQRKRNDVYTKPSGHKNPSVGSPFSIKSKSFGQDPKNHYFENMNEAEQEVLDSFELQSELNPASFSGDKMIPEIRERLMEIAQDFLDGIDFKMDVEDITLTGSLANYNWSKYSDFDLHILVDYEAIDADQDLVKRFFQDIKAIWNIRHNIFLKGYEVEVYVQNTNEDHMSSGVYSVQNDEWVLKPEKEETERDPVDKQNIEKKADDIIFQIDRAEKLLADGKLDDALAAIDRLKQKVRNLRKIGLSKEDGVYSVENLAFKTLRRSMELERLSTLKNKAYDRQMSITQ